MRLQFTLVFCVYLSLACVSFGETNLIFNGDFEAGNTGFYSAYADHTDDPAFNRLDGGSRYIVAPSPQYGHPHWPAYGDHTSGTGLMLIANGATDGRVVWGQSNIPVVAGTQYTFAYFLSSWNTVKPALMECRINGEVIGTASGPISVPSWVPVSHVWNSGANTTATIELRDLETAWVGNDFMVDDISLILVNTPPVGVLNPASQTVEIDSTFTIKATAEDPDGDVLTYQLLKGSEIVASGIVDTPDDGSPIVVADLTIAANDPRFGMGSHTVDLVLKDPVNGPVLTTATVTVADSTEPTLAPVSSESILWPPNHELRPITITANASDNGGDVTLTATVQSNEPQEDGGDGSTDQDWTMPVIDNQAGTIELSLRAERSGSEEGRVYTITITATDPSGNASVATVEVRVPHDRRKK
jgi:hypothetical protein